MSDTTTVPSIPPCDFDGTPATVDGKTTLGPWANMCDACFAKYGIGLGTGKGQRLVAS